MKAGASAGRMPAKVSVAERADVTAGLANDVEAVNHELAEHLRGPRARVARGEEERRLEHDVRGRDAAEGAGDLGPEVHGDVAPGQTALRRIGERHRGIEVRPRDRPEGEDERHQRRPGGDGVREEREPDVAAGQPLAHDPGPDDGGQEQRGPHRFGGEATREREGRRVGSVSSHWRPRRAGRLHSSPTSARDPVETTRRLPA